MSAFGMAEAPTPDRFLIALAVLELLSEAAELTSMLIVVDDAQWLDRSSGDVLAVVARRIEHEPIVMLVASRYGGENCFDDAGLPELRLWGLDETAAGALLTARAPGLTPAVRERMLKDAEGNPLALVELPVSLGTQEVVGHSPLPLSERLEQAFASRVAGLPPSTRTLLLLAAADEDGLPGEILAAAAKIDGTGFTAEDFAPAIDAELVRIDHAQISFRHPLMRSAVYQRAVLIQEAFDTGEDAVGIEQVIEVTEGTWQRDSDSALNVLRRAAGKSWWVSRSEERRMLLVAAVQRMGVPEEDPQRLAILALSGSTKHAADVLGRLSRVSFDGASDPIAARLLGLAEAASRAGVRPTLTGRGRRRGSIRGSARHPPDALAPPPRAIATRVRCVPTPQEANRGIACFARRCEVGVRRVGNPGLVGAGAPRAAQRRRRQSPPPTQRGGRAYPQELQIARMVASGLSNREIGRQLYLAHRTVGAHLYRAFPKLGITSRGQLRDALDTAAP
jgi:Bacterial regulatory proteins, luxR family